MSHERWLVSYADFITLLFAFFTTLYAISNIDAGKLREASGSMRSAFDEPPAAPQVIAGGGGATLVAPASGDGGALGNLSGLRERLRGRLERQLLDGVVTLGVDPRGLVVSMQEAGAFATGKADLSEAARALLREIADVLRDARNPVRVEGHTDDVPIETARYASNWDLSTARATAVIRYLTQDLGLPASQFSAAGYGEFRPKVPNDSDAHRAQNRRVDLIILNPATTRAEEPR